MGILSRLFGKHSPDPVSLSDSPGVYCIRNPENGRIYVGATTKPIIARWNKHREELYSGSHSNTLLLSDWQSYGETAFVFEVLEVVDDPDSVFAREGYWLSQYPTNLLYNIQKNGSPTRSKRRLKDEMTYYPAYIQVSDHMSKEAMLEFLALSYYADGTWCHSEDSIVKLFRRQIPEDKARAQIERLRDGFTPIV